MLTKNDYIQIVHDCGFSKYNIVEVNRDRYFPSADELIIWIDQPSIVPYISSIPDEMRAEFRDDVIKAMLERTVQSKGTCF